MRTYLYLDLSGQSGKNILRVEIGGICFLWVHRNTSQHNTTSQRKECFERTRPRSCGEESGGGRRPTPTGCGTWWAKTSAGDGKQSTNNSPSPQKRSSATAPETSPSTPNPFPNSVVPQPLTTRKRFLQTCAVLRRVAVDPKETNSTKFNSQKVLTTLSA